MRQIRYSRPQQRTTAGVRGTIAFARGAAIGSRIPKKKYLDLTTSKLSGAWFVASHLFLWAETLEWHTTVMVVGDNSQSSNGGDEGSGVGGSSGSIDDNNNKPTNGNGKVGFRERIEHFTWANFTGTQSTGGIAILLSETPHQFHGLQTAGAVVFILNLVLFAVFCAAMLTRFYLHPHTIKKSLTMVPECLFVGPFFLSCATIIICSKQHSCDCSWLMHWNSRQCLS